MLELLFHSSLNSAVSAFGGTFQTQLGQPVPVTGDAFGASVSVSSDGNIALVGSPGSVSGTGKAYIFIRTDGIWSLQATLTASDGVTTDLFGYAASISSDGNTALVGAYQKATSLGAVYIFSRTDTTWTQQAKIVASDGVANDRFGYCVSLSVDGNTVVVGAPGKTSNTGTAYIFTRSGTSWTQQAVLNATDRVVNDQFGGSVSLSSDGNSALIGANGKASGVGTAYVFTRSGTSWTQQAKLLASDGATNAYFGISVSLSADGNTALIGAYSKASGSGGAYIFGRSGAAWAQQDNITINTPLPSDRFGCSVSLSLNGTIAVIGAFGRTSNRGAAYVFKNIGNVWTVQNTLLDPNASTGGRIASAVDISEDGLTVIVGARLKNTTVTSSGAAFIFI